MFKDSAPAPTNLNILLAKLRPGQEIEMEMHANKGIGAEHAKWSPVGETPDANFPLAHTNLFSDCDVSPSSPY